MASNCEKLLLKQITDLTRQIEKQKKGFGRTEFQSKKFVKPWSKKSSTTFYNVYANGAQHWRKPVLSGLPTGQSQTSRIQPKPSPKPSASKQYCSSQNQTSSTSEMTTKPKQVFVNPNFVSGRKGLNVHVNPNFRPQSPVLHPAGASEPVAGTSASSGASVAAAIPTSNWPVNSTPSGHGPSSVSTAVGLSGPVQASLSESGAGYTGYVPGGPSRPLFGTTSAGPSAPVPGPSGSAQSVPAAPGRTRRRSRSLSSRYRLLTARKLVRRLSRETRTPPTPAAARRATVHTRHKLVRAARTPRAQLASKLVSTRHKLVSTRHKLVRVVSTPRSQQQQQQRHQLGRQAASRAAAVSWSSTRGAAPVRTAPAPSSRYRLVRTAPAAASGAAPGPVRSQHRTWRRRSSTSTPAGRLTSAGSLRLGSTRFVNIGGLLYKSTARKLQRAIPKATPKNRGTSSASGTSPGAGGVSTSPSWISVRGARFRVEGGGRSLRRLERGPPAPPRLDIGGLTFRPAADGTLTADRRQQVNRSLISRAKSRSLAVLRGSLRLSRQPCRFFCRWGRCHRHERRQCPHVHDPALRPICTRHLQEGGCRREGCPYNHHPRPEKVPHCLHFLTAECRREGCPYQHVNVDADAPLCAKFLAGFCPRGQQCTDKHLYICPEFSEKGECPRGSKCPLAHRARRRRRRSSSARAAPTAATPRGRDRYYLGERAETATVEVGPEGESDEEEEEEGGSRRRPAMAEMPSFIAIGDSSGDEE